MLDKQQASAVTLDSVEQAIANWRANKDQHPGTGIPDNIWRQIFSLESPTRSAHKLRAMFGLNSQQYKKKYAQLITGNTTPETAPVTSTPLPAAPAKPNNAFAEVCVESQAAPSLASEVQATKDTIKAIKQTKIDLDELLDPNTVVVECIRNDGHRLKIHTCSQRIDVILQAFYSQAMAA